MQHGRIRTYQPLSFRFSTYRLGLTTRVQSMRQRLRLMPVLTYDDYEHGGSDPLRLVSCSQFIRAP